MTIEEIRAMCDSVINTTNQVNKDYEILRLQGDSKIKEIGDKIEAKLKEIILQYKDIFQSLYSQAQSLKERDECFYIPIEKKIEAPKLHDYDYPSDNCLFFAYYNDKFIFTTCISKDEAEKSKGNPYGVRITSGGWYSKGNNSISYDNVFEAFRQTLKQNNLRNVIEVMTFMLENMEDLVQKLIADVAKRILDYTIERNAKITDNL